LSGQSWSIVEVARMSGVTSRTLRHYDEIELLRPAFVGANGYRYYDEEGLLRLQQILLLRQLGVPLAEITKILDKRMDALSALRAHQGRLLAEQDHLQALLETVKRTIAELEDAEKTMQSVEEGEEPMTKISRPENLFEGFDPSKYDDEARDRWPEAWAQSKAYVDTLNTDDIARMQREQTAAMIRVAELMVAGIEVSDDRVQHEIDLAYQGVCRFWTPNAAAFTGLGQMYVDDERFTQNYERIAAGLAEYYRDAMAVYAQRHLT